MQQATDDNTAVATSGTVKRKRWSEPVSAVSMPVMVSSASNSETTGGSVKEPKGTRWSPPTTSEVQPVQVRLFFM
jgi:hypothetical protein